MKISVFKNSLHILCFSKLFFLTEKEFSSKLGLISSELVAVLVNMCAMSARLVQE